MGLSLIFMMLIGVFSYFNAQQLTSLYSEQRKIKQQQTVVEFNGLLKKTGIQLVNLVDSLSLLSSPNPDIREKISLHWLSLAITWGLESAVLMDEEGDEVTKWGSQPLEPTQSVVRKVVTDAVPLQELRCHEECRLSLISPVLDSDGTIRFLQLTASLADTILDFQRITQSDIGIITPSASDAYGKDRLGKTSMIISALTSSEDRLPLIQNLAKLRGWRDTDIEGMDFEVFTHDYLGDQFEVQFFAIEEFAGNQAWVVVITETSELQRQIDEARMLYTVTGLSAGMITLFLIVLVLWRPIRSLQRQARALPLLPQGKYEEARERLKKMAPNRVFADEISLLQSTSIKVTHQLEEYHLLLTQNTKKLYDMAHFDRLTGLTNRVHMTEILEDKFTSEEDKDRIFALMLLDLDHFKRINDALGHNIGDQLLVIVAKRLLSKIRASDTIARLGGDEFCLILNGLKTETAAAAVARNLLKALEEPIHIDDRNLTITASIGITMSPADGASASSLLQNADLAMYQAKFHGRDNFHFFNFQLHKDADTRMALEVELRRAVQDKEFTLFYQPQIDFATGRILGCEALIRWKHPEKGLLSPYFFIDTLENNGLIVPVGKWVMEEACRQCLIWREDGLGRVDMSINLSPRQFADPDLLEHIQTVVNKTQLEPNQLEIEVTESLLATDVDYAVTLLEKLQEMKIHIAIDDFGTGYSSLSYLKQLPLDKLKVDRAFVMDIPNNND
ncbi:MAG: EAL domain-containing protein, partial [Pseudomonadales bacterium]|nr:EAL domain-containing protein [Pseudomonadales bacterium]